MEHESFENEKVAEIMNREFVNIKVDREEQPGVDKVYMMFLQMTSGGGGWPMSVFLTPSLHPFYAGTYYPEADTMGRPGFVSVLKKISDIWKENPEKLNESGQDVVRQIKQYLDTQAGNSSADINFSVADKTFTYLFKKFDSVHGGFSGAPKFPTPAQLFFLLDYYGYNKHGNIGTDKIKDMSVSEMRKLAHDLGIDLTGAVEKTDVILAIELGLQKRNSIAAKALEMVEFTLKVNVI